MFRFQHPGVRVIALFEAAKAAVVLLAGFGCLALLHRDARHIATQLIKHCHLNPAHHYPQIFIDAASKVTDTHLWLLASLALAYAVIRGAEAYGLWYEQRWAEWLALLSGMIYLPIEFYELCHGVSWMKVCAVVINFLIIIYMAYRLRRQHQTAGQN
ncbi:MAG: hypothetical protein JWN70_5460 [Planctomycetaceae bacterium]|nr:hypothetical protein [Planctomycetaceae bacterium]